MNFLKCLLIVSILIHEAFSSSLYSNNEVRYRIRKRLKALPAHITPLEYSLKLTPYLDTNDGKAFTFKGIVSIVMRANEEHHNSITLHSKYINITNVIAHQDLQFKNYTMEPENDFLILNFAMMFKKDANFTISIHYDGILQDDMTGFYKSSYIEDNKTQWLATTQFQSYDARKAFPCFDEPSYKTPFKISIECPKDYTCLSNMKEEKRVDDLVSFHPTPPMSTYIIAFIVSKFVPARQTEQNNREPFAIWARPDVNDSGDFAFEIGQKVLKEMNSYFALKYYDMYPNIKMDQVAIPDFWPGAMENWGLITYREAYLMYHPKESSTKHKQQVASVMTHEFSHMWFGNLVTCSLWTHGWLNEGFATYFQFFFVDKVEDFGSQDQFIITQHQSSLLTDTTLKTSTAGDVTPRKGAAIIRMISHWIGFDAVQNGLNRYLNENKYKAVVPEDLYDALQAESGLSSEIPTVNSVMGSWIRKSGYPLLTVNVLDRSTGLIQIRQEKFVVDNDQDNSIFSIPITYTMESNANFANTTPAFIMSEKQHMFKTRDIPGGWIIFNIQQTGYYRINYDEHNWDLIAAALADDVDNIHKYNRAQIIDDVYNFVREDLMDLKMMLKIVQYLHQETEYTPWSAAINAFNFLRLRFSKNETVLKAFDQYILNLMKTVIQEFDLEDTNNDGTNLDKIFRANALKFACALGHEACIESSLNLFYNFKNFKTRISPDLREHVYCAGLRLGDDSDFDFLWDKYINEQVFNEKVVILSNLGCTLKQNKIMEYLMKTIDLNSGIRSQDRMTAFNSVLVIGNIESAKTASTFLMNNIKDIRKIYGQGNVYSMITNIFGHLPRKDLMKLYKFFKSSPLINKEERVFAEKEVLKALEGLKWADENSDILLDSMKVNQYNSAEKIRLSFISIFIMIFVLIFQ